MWAAAAALTLTLAATGHAWAAEPSLCKPPTPNPRVTAEILRQQGGDTTPEAVTAVNALYEGDDCEHAAAWRLRHKRGSPTRLAHRIRSECAAPFATYDAMQTKVAAATGVTPAALAEKRRDSERKQGEVALQYVREYRGCRD